MIRQLTFLGLTAACLAIGACGGSSSSSTSASSTANSATATSSTSASSTETQASQTSSTTTTTRSSRSFKVQSTDVRLPVDFVVRPGGRLVPPQISVPGELPIELSVRSGDGAAHHVVLRSPSPTTLSVPAGGRASVRITGLKKGGYQIEVDGKTAGQLVIGVAPGP